MKVVRCGPAVVCARDHLRESDSVDCGPTCLWSKSLFPIEYVFLSFCFLAIPLSRLRRRTTSCIFNFFASESGLDDFFFYCGAATLAGCLILFSSSVASFARPLRMRLCAVGSREYVASGVNGQHARLFFAGFFCCCVWRASFSVLFWQIAPISFSCIWIVCALFFARGRALFNSL